MPPTDEGKPDLSNAGDTDEIYRLAYDLAAWGLRNGECDEYDAVEWVLGHPHESSLPRGSSGRPNATQHHITKGAEAAVEKYEPWVHRAEFDPDVLHALAERTEGSGVTHERYLLGAVALCHRYQTLTPVITGPSLAEVVGVNASNAYRVLNEWGSTLAYGFFTGVSYDGVKGHGRVWTVDPDWSPVSKPKHLPGCNRSKARCKCPGVANMGSYQLAAAKDSYPKVRQTRLWLDSLKWQQKITVSDACKGLGVTRAAATKLLESEEGRTFEEVSIPSRVVMRRSPQGGYGPTRTARTWIVADRWQRWPDGIRPQETHLPDEGTTE